MGSFGVELADEGIEAGLLLQAVATRGPRGLLLQGQMHSLMAAVLLGVAWLDALDGDTEPEPPDGKLGEVEQAVGTGEGNAVIRPDGLGETPLPEELLEGRDGEIFTRGLVCVAEKHKAGGVICHGQRVA